MSDLKFIDDLKLNFNSFINCPQNVSDLETY